MKAQGKEEQMGGFLNVGALGTEDKSSARGDGEKEQHEPDMLCSWGRC